jgi:SAM-dependent methyltransferase
MSRLQMFLILLGTAVAVIVRHGCGAATGRKVRGGILMGDAVAYDLHSRLLMGSLFGPIAADVAAVAPGGAQVLEVGCGPGNLSIRLARQHGLDVTGLDLDPAMIQRARANADRARAADERRPSFLIGDVASLPFPDGSFELVVSTLSMHHWADATAGLAEIGRVLRPGARALIWDFRAGFLPFHGRLPDPIARTDGSPLRVLEARPWRWPWRFELAQRIELVQRPSAGDHANATAADTSGDLSRTGTSATHRAPSRSE